MAYLPAGKQYLVTHRAPCATRASEVESAAGKTSYVAVDVDGDDGWVCEAHSLAEGAPVDDALEDAGSGGDDSDGSIPDMEGYDEENVVDEAALGEDHLVAQRAYDIAITYDNYYNTPRMWLYGYDEKGVPLKTAAIFDDVSEDHARKTVTIDAHPFVPAQTWAYIHPCKHATVMKSMLDRMAAHGKAPRVDHYLFIFLKLMSAVLPTIEYDLSPELSI